MRLTRKFKFSKKQKTVLSWWYKGATSSYDGIICDGAVRSGKSFCMSASFIIWAMSRFDKMSFGICGKTISSLRRNVISPLIPFITGLGMEAKEQRSKNTLTVSFGRRQNTFYLFGGKDEGSASLIQGVTLAGIYLDEVVLMPRSFVEQAVARCSVTGSKLWFNCNPQNPFHWFKTDWIDLAHSKNILYLHFSLNDNPSLSPDIRKRYHTLYTGAFYERFVLGLWTATSGNVYENFSRDKHIFSVLPADAEIVRYAVSCDYGTVNPSSFGLWAISRDGRAFRIDEYYYASKTTGIQRTDEEHYEALERLCEGYSIDSVICDPSARSFIECILRHGRFSVVPAKNDVLNGIRKVSSLLSEGRLLFSEKCKDTIREFYLYRWDEKCKSDTPIKENDHAMDDIRYFAVHFMDDDDSFYALSVGRR